MYNVSLCLKMITSENISKDLKEQFLGRSMDYLIDPTFRNINTLFVLSFKNGDNDPTRNSFDKYYMPLVQIKDFNALIDNKTLFDQPVKNKKRMKNLSKCLEIMKWNRFMKWNSIPQQLISQENQKKMVPQCFLLLKSSKKLFYEL